MMRATPAARCSTCRAADPFTVQPVLGHSQLSTTRRHTRVPMQVTKSAVAGPEALFENARKKTESQPEAKRAISPQESTQVQ